MISIWHFGCKVVNSVFHFWRFLSYHSEAASKKVVCPTEIDLESLAVPGEGVAIGHSLHISLFLVHDGPKPGKSYSQRP